MRTWVAVVVLATALGTATDAAAQEADAAERRARSISLAVNDGIEIGYWTRLSERSDLGLNVGVALETLGNDDTEQSLLSISFEPAIKRYATADGPFLPYGYGSLIFSYGRLTSGVTQGGADVEITRDQQRYGASAGIGMDWFPAQRISVGGHAGLAGGYQSTEAGGDFFQEDGEQTGFFVNTFSSGIRVHLYL